MNLKILTLSLSMAFAFSATAQEKVKKAKAPKAPPPVQVVEPQNGSEYQYQAPAGKFVVQPRLIYSSLTTKSNSTLNNAKINQTGLKEEFKFEYGINPSFSVGLVVSNADTTRTMSSSPLPEMEETKFTGLEDPVLFFNARKPMGVGELRYGANLTYSIEKHKITETIDENNASGGMTLAPFVGYEVSTGNRTLGLRALYEAIKNDRKVDNKFGLASTGTESGGEAFVGTLFYEHNFTSSLIGTSLEVVAAKKLKSNLQNRSLGALTIASARIYGRLEVTPNFAILPSAAFGQGTAIDMSMFESMNLWDIKVAGRFTF